MFDIIDSEACFSKAIAPYRLIKGEFDVCEPYFRAKKEDTPTPKKRRKKNTTAKAPSVTDIETQKRHEELRPLLMSCIEQLETIWPQRWKDIKEASPREGGDKTETIYFPSIQSMVETAQGKFNYADAEEETVVKEHNLTSFITKDLDLFSIFNVMCTNAEDKLKLLEMTPTCQYIIPPKSAFLMGSIQNSAKQLGSYVSKLGGADLMVLDPPWPNKSVSRSSHYDTQDIYELYAIPIKEMISTKDTVVAIWVTNKPKFRNFIINKLFPSCQLECVSEWTWLKVTTQGECIFPLDSPHKKPYEQLIIGRPINLEHTKTLPKTHTIVSIPSVRHSRKPPLQDVLSPYLDVKNDPVYVELFARCLTPGWISWGNECLAFQHLNYFIKEE